LFQNDELSRIVVLMSASKDLSKQLKNIGPTLADRMVDAGIDTPEKLRAMGAKKAFQLMYATGDNYGDFNAAYLYALEGAIRDCDWSSIPDSVRDDYRAYAQNLQEIKKARGD